MNTILKILHHLSTWVGKIVAWAIILLIIIIGLDVLMRYAFSISSPAVFELEWHLFAALFLLGSAYTLGEDRHVRVDVFYSHFKEKTKYIIDILGTILFLLPFCFVVVYSSIEPVFEAYEINESSPDPGGLPFRFVIKAVVPISFILLMLQGISIVVRKLKLLFQ